MSERKVSAVANAAAECALEVILKACNAGHKVTFLKDWGENTMTVIIDDKLHAHVGTPGGNFKELSRSVSNQVWRLALAPEQMEL